MPVPFLLGSAEPAVGAASEPVEVEQVDRLVTYEEQHEGPGEEPLPPESDMFYDTEEFQSMENVWRRMFCLDDQLLDDTLSLRGLVRRMRALTDELQGLSAQGYMLDLDATEGDMITLVNPDLEREQWRLRRQRRRAAMAQEQSDDDGEVPGAQPPPRADAMETDEGEGNGVPPASAQQQQPRPAAAAPKSPRAPPPAFELC